MTQNKMKHRVKVHFQKKLMVKVFGDTDH